MLKGKVRATVSFMLVLAMIATLFTGMGSVETKAAQATYFKAYEKAAYETTSKDFSLKVNGENVDVVSYYKERYSYAHIAYEGTTTFEIKALQGNIESYNISPHSYNIQAKIDGNTMTFDMEQKKSRYLVIDITAGGKKDQFIIAADPKLDLKAPEVDGNKVVSIVDYGVVAGDKGDGSENSQKIQEAINDVSSRGGGTVVVPKGWYKFVTIDSKDNVTLYLDEGAVLRGSGDRTEYSWNGPGGNGRQVKRRDIKITSKNFHIIGEGMVDANAVVLALPKNNDRTDVPNTPQGDYYPTGWDDFRKGIVDADGADGINFTGVTFKDATGWTFNITKSKNINIHNVKMLDDYAVVHSDGYDIVACQDVEVTNCLGICGDDVFCPKGSDSNREMKNYLYKDCVAYARGGAGCKVGVQAKSKSYNIEFNNIDVIQGYRGFSISRDEGESDWSDIRFIDVRTEKVFVESNPTDNGQYRPAPIVIWAVQKNNVTGNVSDIEVTNCSIEDTAGIKAVMKGETVGSTGEKGTVSDVTFNNFVVEGRTITQENWQRYFEVSGNVKKDTIKFKHTDLSIPAISKYEGETAAKDGANHGKSEECSSGFKAGSIGKSGDKNNTVTFTVYVEEAGEHEIKVYACTKGERSFEITVNDGEVKNLDCDGDSFNTPIMYTIKADLKEGENKIVFGNSQEAAPDLDKIEVIEREIQEGTVLDDEKALTIEMEAGLLAPEDTLTVEASEQCSNGYFVGDVGTETGGTITFKIQAEEAGRRKLDICYITEMNRKLSIKVNDATAQTVICRNLDTTDWKTPEHKPLSTEVELQEGENTLVISSIAEDGAYAPNLDRLEIELTAAEAAKTVEGLIANLPTEINDENQIFFHAVGTSYEDLTNKEDVSNGDVLRTALGLPELPKDQETQNPGEGENPSENQDPYTPEEDDSYTPEENDPYIPEENNPPTPDDNDSSTSDDNNTDAPGTSDDNNTDAPETDETNQKFTVTFDSAGGTEVSEQTIEKGKTVTKPENPEKEGYVFLGWYVEDTEYDFTTPVNDALTLLAKWEEQEITYTVTFDSAGGSEVVDETVKKGEAVDKPENPQKEGYTFKGWYLEEDAYDFDSFVEGDITLVARWEKIEETTPQEEQKPEDTSPNNGQQNTDKNQQNQQTNNNSQSMQGVKVGGIIIRGISDEIAAGKTIDLDVDVLPANATDASVIWTTSNTSYATVDGNGVVTTKKAGVDETVTITAEAKDGSGVKDEYTIRIMQKAVKKIKLSAKSKTIAAGKKLAVKATITPKASAKKINSKLIWISENPKYATVSSKGVVKTKKAGKGKKVKITAMATDGSNKKATMKIKIK